LSVFHFLPTAGGAIAGVPGPRGNPTGIAGAGYKI